MSASHAPALDAIAFQLVASLEKYAADVGRMVDTWLDMDLYRDVSEQVEEIRLYSAALPAFSSAWVELLIAHAELVHSLWRLEFRENEAHYVKLKEVRSRHAESVERLQAACRRNLSHAPALQRAGRA